MWEGRGERMNANDELIERRLDEEIEKLVSAKTRAEQVRAADHIRELVSWRSPQRVAQMEEERGLRR